MRYRWMFRTAALLFLFLGVVWLWRFGLTDYHPEQRPYGLAAGVAGLIVGTSLLMLKRWAIVASALAIAFVGVCAAVFAPNSRGPAILALAALALACLVYAVLAVRVALAARRPGGRS